MATEVKPAARPMRELSRFLKFTVVGGIGFIVDFSVFNLLAGVFDVWTVLASMVSFSAAVMSNFIWNRYWTYPDSRSKQLRRQAAQFFLVNLAGLVIRTPVYAVLEPPSMQAAQQILDRLTALSAINLTTPVLGRNLALAFAVIVVLFWNFGANRIWTYSDVS